MSLPRIDLAAPPFAGHLHPIVGIARLLQPDFQVRVLTTSEALPQVQTAGLDGHALLPDCEERITAITETPSAVGSNPLRLLRQLREALDLQRQLHSQLSLLYATDRPHLLIADFTLVAAGTVATQLAIPWWTSLPSPCVLEDRGAPPAYFGGLKPQDGLLASVRDGCARQVTQRFKRLVSFCFRNQLREIGIEHAYRDDGSEAAYSNQRILAFGNAALEFCKQWPAHVSLLPMPLYCPPGPCDAPPFVGGRPHVLVTLGTHLRFAKNTVADAVRQLAQGMPEAEFHFTDGLMKQSPAIKQGNFTRLPFVNYSQHLAAYTLIIHHGGSGVMHHTLAAGRPAVVYPLDYDQFDNAARLETSGLALRLRRLKDLDLLVRRALADREMLERCRRFARRMDRDTAATLVPAVARFLKERAA